MPLKNETSQNSITGNPYRYRFGTTGPRTDLPGKILEGHILAYATKGDARQDSHRTPDLD